MPHCDPNNMKAKFCTGSARDTCGHLVELHDMEKGCTQVVESSTSEDRWVCGCKCVVCIHLSLERRTIRIRKEQQEEEEQLRERGEQLLTVD